MNRTFSIVYTLFVVIVLLCVIGFFGWEIYQSRTERMSILTTNTPVYTRRLSDTLVSERDVNAELAVAEEIMSEEPSLVAVQVFSHDDGLRLSVVKPTFSEFSRTLIAGSDELSSPIAQIRYHVVNLPMNIPDMQGLEATFVSSLLSGAEIRNYLLITLVAVAGLLFITFLFILVKPRQKTADNRKSRDRLNDDDLFSDDFQSQPSEDAFINDSINGPDNGDFGPMDMDEGLEEDSSFAYSADAKDDSSVGDAIAVPNLEDLPTKEEYGESPLIKAMLIRLENELERSASLNEDLSVILFTGVGKNKKRIRDFHTSKDLIFALGNNQIGVIEPNQDLDTTLSFTEELLLECIEQTGTRALRAGITSRTGRLIGAQRLFREAEEALRKSSKEKNIVAFRSDPEKYREFLRNEGG